MIYGILGFRRAVVVAFALLGVLSGVCWQKFRNVGKHLLTYVTKHPKQAKVFI
jgi:hypothetical protein